MKIALFWAVAGVTLFLALYVIGLRTWLKSKPWMQWLYTSRVGEWVELTFFKKSDTLLWARFKALAAVLLVMLPQIGAVDLTPVLAFIPEDYQWIKFIPSVALFLDGAITETQRRQTTKPLELVAIPESTPLPPQVEAVLADAEALKKEAVAAVTEAKKQGTV